MSDIAQVSLVRDPSPPPPPPPRPPISLLDRSGPLFALFLGVGLVVFIAALQTVHSRPPELLKESGGASRAHHRITHWIDDGYFHYLGLFRDKSAPDKIVIYRTSTGAYMVSTYIVEKVYFAFTGRYSWRLASLHNQIVSLLLSALFGMLAFRITKRMGLDSRLAFAAGASVVIVVFTFPNNLALYWEMSSQAYALLFAAVFFLIEERCSDGRRTPASSIAQAAAIFLMTAMESIFGLACVAALAAALLVLGPSREAWRRFFLVVLAPCAAVFALHALQLNLAAKRFPTAEVTGSTIMFRSGLDGESLYYADHLDIARRRDVARGNWKVNREYLFRWKWVFILGAISTLAVIAAYIAKRAPRIAIEVLTGIAGGWLLYAAVFSQAVMIHPYLYDVLLFTPLVLALFAFAPALAESLTRRTGAILLVVVLSACWYSLFQMRRYALQYPMPGAKVAPPPAAASPR
jgi:hypothetical protein